MVEDISIFGELISFKTLGKTLPRLPKKKPKFIIQMGGFAQYGFCPYTAWHLGEGTTPILVPKVEQAQTVGKVIHDELDVVHEKKIAKLPKATEKTRRDKYKPLEFPRNLPVSFYHRPFLYTGKLDNIRRMRDGNFYVTEDKTTKLLPSRPWFNHRLQVWAYCAGMASAYWRRYDARYLCWRIRYLDRTNRRSLGDFEGFYDTISHRTLLDSLEKFETIYQGNDLGFEVNPNKCGVCGYRDGCPFRK
jgi:CRISPR/Cas system-associated exonuclease Cas4 (RecB family)